MGSLVSVSHPDGDKMGAPLGGQGDLGKNVFFDVLKRFPRSLDPNWPGQLWGCQEPFLVLGPHAAWHPSGIAQARPQKLDFPVRIMRPAPSPLISDGGARARRPFCVLRFRLGV